ncbi:ABC transporter permease [Phocaeicola sp.]
MKQSPFIAVLKRELNRMISRRLYFAACILLPLGSIFFMATIFGNGQMENLPIGIVDGDNTATSREIIRTTESVPTFCVTKHYANETEARADVQRKNIYGYLSIPPGFEAKVMDGKETALTYYYHYALMSVGSEIHGAFQSLLKNISVTPIVTHAVALGMNQEEIQSFLLPIVTQNHPLFNPDMDYSIYLTHPFFFVFLQVILLLVTTYAIGSEGKFHTSADWLATADGSIWTAVTAKLLPYTLIFIAMSVLANYVYFGIMHIPMDCGFWPLNLTSALFVIATQALAVFLFSVFPALSIIISIVSMVGSLGATLSGVTFPVPHMFAPVYYTSYLFPVRHFVEIGQNLLYGNYGYAYMWTNVACLFLFLLPPLLLLPHLKRSLISQKYDNIE